jgi:hypothetical protein
VGKRLNPRMRSDKYVAPVDAYYVSLTQTRVPGLGPCGPDQHRLWLLLGNPRDGVMNRSCTEDQYQDAGRQDETNHNCAQRQVEDV